MPDCIVCATSQAKAVCETCAAVTGVIELAPPRRRTAPCVRCNHAKLIRVIPRELSVRAGRDSEHSTDSNVASYAPMFATYKVWRRLEPRLFGADRTVVSPPSPSEGFGVFEAYICKRCGFVDWYCQDPENIPIGPEYMTEEIDAAGSEPYR